MRDLTKRGALDRATARGADRIEVLQLEVNSSDSREPAIYSTCSATKHALGAYTAGLDLELAPFGIRCSSVAPGGYRTAVLENVLVPLESRIYARADEVISRWRAFASGNPDLTPVVDA